MQSEKKKKREKAMPPSTVLRSERCPDPFLVRLQFKLQYVLCACK